MPPNVSQRKISHQGLDISLEIIRARRKSLAIHVFPGERPTEVRVPLKCSWVDVDAFIESRLDWIADALRKLAAQPVESKFKRGQVHAFLGKGYVLEPCFGKSSVMLTPDQLWISCKHPESEAQIERVFLAFLRRESEAIFKERLAGCLANFPEPVSPTGLRVRRMKARWGSCSERGEICLNTLLIQKSPEVIDMVITHELCHLVHFQHDRQFYQLMDRAMPDWREREVALGAEIEPGSTEAEVPQPEQLSFL
tara:strand:- start:2153 stop:2911 length:759 start_codon:yes stop_codon:yes gene_type:complete